jgi:hypothetical protein
MKLSDLPGLSLVIRDVLGCLRRRPIPFFSFNNTFLFVSKNESSKSLALLTVKNSGEMNIPGTIKRSSFPIPAESVISSPSSNIIALLTQDLKSLVVFDLSAGKKLLQQSMAVPLVFWSFINQNLVAIVTPHTVYTWNTSKIGPPVKYFDRVDIPSTIRWAERKILDIQATEDHLLLLSCRRVSAEKSQQVTQNQSDEDTTVTLHYNSSKKSLLFKCLSGAFIPKETASAAFQFVCLLYIDEIKSELYICVFNLSMLENLDIPSENPINLNSDILPNYKLKLCSLHSNLSSNTSKNNLLIPAAYIYSTAKWIQLLLRSGKYFAIEITSEVVSEQVVVKLSMQPKLISSEGVSIFNRQISVYSSGMFSVSNLNGNTIFSNFTVFTEEENFENITTML